MFGLMGNCFKCLNRRSQPPRKITLVLVGLDNAGKTTTIKGVQGESIEDVAPTVGFSSVTFKMEHCSVTVYDLGGGKKIRDIWKNYYAEVYGVIFVIDASDESRIEECRDVLQKVLRQERVMGKRVLVLANKQDQTGALDEIDVCDQLNLEDMVNECKCPCKVQSCSAVQRIGKKMDQNIKEGMQWLLHGIERDWATLHERVEGEMAEHKKAEEMAKKERLARVKKIREERKRKKEEEKKQLGITDDSQSDEEEVVQGDPFKKLDEKYFTEKKKKDEMKKKKKPQKINIITVSQASLRNEDVSQAAVASKSCDTLRTAPSSGSQDLDRSLEGRGAGDRFPGMPGTNEKEAKEMTNSAVSQLPALKQLHGAENRMDHGGCIQLNTPSVLQGFFAEVDEPALEKKKKKKKSKFRNNKLAPMPLDNPGETSIAPPPVPSWANSAMPSLHSSIKSSHRPVLEPVVEGHGVSPRPTPRLTPRLQPLQPVKDSSSQGNLQSLPNSADIFGPRRTKPNSEQDDDIFT